MALKSCPKSNKSPNLITLAVARKREEGKCLSKRERERERVEIKYRNLGRGVVFLISICECV